MAIDVLAADDMADRQMGKNILDVATRDSAFWLTYMWLDCPTYEPCQAFSSFSP